MSSLGISDLLADLTGHRTNVLHQPTKLYLRRRALDALVAYKVALCALRDQLEIEEREDAAMTEPESSHERRERLADEAEERARRERRD